VTSSTTTAGGAAPGTGLGPRRLNEVLGIVKAYATRVGAGPFPTELFDEFGEHLSRVGHEFGSVTGRRRRCGWFDAVALRRSIIHSSCSALCVTKLDVLDGLDTIRVCVGYKIDGKVTTTPPLLSENFGECLAVYEELPGWKQSSVGITRYEELPANARSYLERLQSLVGVPITIISTGPDRDQTIMRQNPFS
jgi:adenylosuccinate synthase